MTASRVRQVAAAKGQICGFNGSVRYFLPKPDSADETRISDRGAPRDFSQRSIPASAIAPSRFPGGRCQPSLRASCRVHAGANLWEEKMIERLPSSMVRKSAIRDVAGATALAVTVCWPGAADAGHSSRPHPFDSASVQWVPEGGGRGAPPQIFVGHDGNRYTDIVGEFSTRFRLRADVKSGWRIHGFVLTTGDPDMTDDLPVEQIGGGRGIYTDDLDIFQSFTMDAAQAVQQAV